MKQIHAVYENHAPFHFTTDEADSGLSALAARMDSIEAKIMDMIGCECDDATADTDNAKDVDRADTDAPNLSVKKPTTDQEQINQKYRRMEVSTGKLIAAINNKQKANYRRLGQ